MRWMALAGILLVAGPALFYGVSVWWNPDANRENSLATICFVLSLVTVPAGLILILLSALRRRRRR